MGLFDFIGNARNGIGKWQMENGINTALSRGYLTKQNQDYTDKLRGLVEPLINAAKQDQQGSIQSNPNWSMVPQPKPASQGNSLADGLVNTNFAPQYNTNAGLADAVKNTSPITYQAPLSTPEMMRKHAVAYSLAGVKPDALQMGMLSGDENYQAARMANKLELTANEKAELARKYGVDKINALEKAGVIVNKSVETGSKYGTEGNNLTGLTNEILGGMGLKGQLSMAQSPGLETMKTNSQVNRDSAAANASNSTAWRNYNKPFYNPSTGNGSYDKTQIALAQRDIKAHQVALNAAMKNNFGEPVDETSLPTYEDYAAAQEYLGGVKQYGASQQSQPSTATDSQTDNSPASQFIRQAKAEGWSKEQVIGALHGRGITDYDSYVW